MLCCIQLAEDVDVISITSSSFLRLFNWHTPHRWQEDARYLVGGEFLHSLINVGLTRSSLVCEASVYFHNIVNCWH